jgi:tetratricopeptide (TPR) repeat protein
MRFIKSVIVYGLLFCGTMVFAQHPKYDPVVDSLQKVLLFQKHDTLRASTYYKLVKLLCDVDAKAAMEYAVAMERLSDSLGHKPGKARALNGIGNIYLNKGNYRESMFAFLTALRIHEMNGDLQGIAALHSCIGNVYLRLHKRTLALQYYFTAIDFYKKSGKEIGLGQIYGNVGNCYIEDKRYNEALLYYDTALALATKHNTRYTLCVTWVSIGEAYLAMNLNDKAREYLNKCIDGNCDPHMIASSEEMIGKIFLRNRKWDEALAHFRKAEELVQMAGIDYMLPPIYKGISDVLKEKGEYKESLRYYGLFHDHMEADIGTDKQQTITQLQAAYDLERKDREIESLDNGKKVAELQSSQDRIYRNSFIIAFVLALLISIAFIRNAYLKQKVNKILNDNNTALNEKNYQIEHQKSEIEKINAELDRYNKEVVRENIIAKYEILKGKTNPHFLFNSLTSLSALVIRDKSSALQFIEHFSELYRMILEMGENRLITLKQEMKLVRNYLYLEKARFRDNLNIEINVNDSLKGLLLPSFAIQICVENSLKHNTVSEAQKLTISIYTEGNSVVIRNNLQLKSTGVISTSTGQKNIIERYRLISDLVPVFNKSETEYLVKLPLLNKEQNLAL